MHYFKIAPDDLEMSQDNQGWWIIRHKDPAKNLWFKTRYNANITRNGKPDNMMEFEIYDAQRALGKGAQYTLKPNEWFNTFIINGYFNVWLSGRGFRVG